MVLPRDFWQLATPSKPHPHWKTTHIGPLGFNDKPKFTTLKSEPHTYYKRTNIEEF